MQASFFLAAVGADLAHLAGKFTVSRITEARSTRVTSGTKHAGEEAVVNPGVIMATMVTPHC